MRRSIDDDPQGPDDIPPGVDEAIAMTWAVAISDDYDDDAARVVLTVEAIGQSGAGLVTHLKPASARRLRIALRDALREIGEDAGA
jgi:hypothetical protein